MTSYCPRPSSDARPDTASSSVPSSSAIPSSMARPPVKRRPSPSARDRCRAPALHAAREERVGLGHLGPTNARSSALHGSLVEKRFARGPRVRSTMFTWSFSYSPPMENFPPTTPIEPRCSRGHIDLVPADGRVVPARRRERAHADPHGLLRRHAPEALPHHLARDRRAAGRVDAHHDARTSGSSRMSSSALRMVRLPTVSPPRKPPGEESHRRSCPPLEHRDGVRLGAVVGRVVSARSIANGFVASKPTVSDGVTSCHATPLPYDSARWSVSRGRSTSASISPASIAPEASENQPSPWPRRAAPR